MRRTSVFCASRIRRALVVPSFGPVHRSSLFGGTSATTLGQRRFHAADSEKLSASAVNVEEFTLNEEVVKRDMEMLEQWNSLAERLSSARAAHDYAQVLKEVTHGLERLAEVGPLNAPIQCESLLCMEAAQAHYNMEEYDPAMSYAERAEKGLMNEKTELRDGAQLAEIRQFMGYIRYKQGKPKEAHRLFSEVLKWIDVDAKSAMPMQAVAAVNLRRAVLTGVGQSMATMAEEDRASGGGEARELYGKALDILIDALNGHIDEGDTELVKSTLESICTCFEGVGDAKQAVTTCQKYISWCNRHDDEAGIAKGQQLLDDLCLRHNIEKPT